MLMMNKKLFQVGKHMTIKHMRILLLTLLLSGCATGDWSNYNYGPGDWLNDNTSLSVESMYNYEHFLDPIIEIHYVESVKEHCGTRWAQACSYLAGNRCDIFVGELATPGTISHEERHCRGWSHYRPQYELFSSLGSKFQAKEIARASNWFPLEDSEMAIAMASDSNFE
ncbi:Uncharacterised protein [Halioglobus japonicus]|nr:Uncharacterised protein [Halioglobus japonicus]